MQRRQMLTRAEEERLRADNRRKEYERTEHMKMVAQDKLLKANLASDDRVEKKRFARRYKNIIIKSKLSVALVLVA